MPAQRAEGSGASGRLKLTLVADQAAKPGPPPLSEEQALKGALDIRLAYIVTGDKEVDDISKAGLEGLSEILRNRTWSSRPTRSASTSRRTSRGSIR